MVEVWITVGIFTVLFFVAVGGQLVHWNVILIIGAAMVAVGLTVGVVVGISYHLALYRALAPLGILESRWCSWLLCGCPCRAVPFPLNRHKHETYGVSDRA